ncbi:hypothetical protein EMCRGX_G005207 [Ephydatia muelleri]|eukprot:Em0007g991a
METYSSEDDDSPQFEGSDSPVQEDVKVQRASSSEDNVIRKERYTRVQKVSAAISNEQYAKYVELVEAEANDFKRKMVIDYKVKNGVFDERYATEREAVFCKEYYEKQKAGKTKTSLAAYMVNKLHCLGLSNTSVGEKYQKLKRDECSA